jgi:carboxypeptidase PM20D1
LAKKAALLAAAAILLLAAILITKTIFIRPVPVISQPPEKIEIQGSVAERLASAVRIKTVSYGESALFDGAAFSQFKRFLEESFPLVHGNLARREVEGYSLLYRWPGKNPALKPILLLAHMDVVPVEPETESHWIHPPFEGVIADGFIWGRGTLDDKYCLMAILEACELLLGKKYQPERSVYFAFGHDEELGENRGAPTMARTLQSENIDFNFVLDEGMAIVHGLIPGVHRDIAFIGTAEKGYLSLELSVTAEGGHSSVPENQSTIGILSRAVASLEEHQFPARLDESVRPMLDHLASELPFFQKMVLANLWLFEKIVTRRLAKDPLTASLVRTTTAVTMFNAGIKDNVLAPEARAVVNFRIIPGETPESVVGRVKTVIGNDRVKIRMLGGARAPSPVSSINSEGYEYLSRTIAGLFPSAIISPALTMSATDAWHYTSVSHDVYRFMPLRFTYDDLKRIHGVNERIPIASYKDCINFYYHLMGHI